MFAELRIYNDDNVLWRVHRVGIVPAPGDSLDLEVAYPDMPVLSNDELLQVDGFALQLRAGPTREMTAAEKQELRDRSNLLAQEQMNLLPEPPLESCGLPRGHAAA